MAFTITSRQVKNHYYYESIAEGILPLRMMLVPAGSFIMGAPETEMERKSWEGPQHEVTVSQFFMSKYPVTQTQWRAVAAMPPVNRALKSDPSCFEGDLRPVDQVSWHDAVEFCDRLTITTNRQYRLPTESEWEYACRAETTTPFHFGKTLSPDYVNYDSADENDGLYNLGSQGDYRGTTNPVGTFDVANAYGLCDMHGNVWEWCQDHWHESYEGAPTDGSAWLSDEQGAARILRGGSWRNHSENCRSACRFNFNSDTRNSILGFRVSCASAVTQSVHSWLEPVRSWVQADVDGTLSSIKNRENPSVTAKLLILRRLPPETSWKTLSEEYGISIRVLSTFYQTHCLPRLRDFGKSQGYL